MAEFATYYLGFLWTMLQNIWDFFYRIIYAFYKAVILDTYNYFVVLAGSAGEFDVFGWICLIFVSILHLALAFFIIYRLAQLIRRYIVFRSKEVTKDKLMEEIAKLRLQAEELVKEKNKIFALKVGSDISLADISSDASNQTAATDAEDLELITAPKESRFTKLIALDERYERNPIIITMREEDMLSLKDICDRFVNFSASQLKLYYTHDIVRLFFAGIATSKIIILEGISGTGKTSLPYAMGKFFNNNAAIMSVQPSWRDRAELLGYYNEFTKKFTETDFLAALYESTLRDDPNFIVLDEMNLARIEYYFADFLSITEMPDPAEWKIDLIASPQDNDPKNMAYGKLLVPSNVWFIGTANNDDSTFSITDKVYDRAIAIALNEKADYFDTQLTESYTCSADYIDKLCKEALAAYPLTEKMSALMVELDEFLRDKFKVTFGNRILRQLSTFVPVYVACGGTETDGVDFIVSSKILRKLSGLNLPFLQKELGELVSFLDKKFGKGKMKKSVGYVKELQQMN